MRMPARISLLEKTHKFGERTSEQNRKRKKKKTRTTLCEYRDELPRNAGYVS